MGVSINTLEKFVQCVKANNIAFESSGSSWCLTSTATEWGLETFNRVTVSIGNVSASIFGSSQMTALGQCCESIKDEFPSFNMLTSINPRGHFTCEYSINSTAAVALIESAKNSPMPIFAVIFCLAMGAIMIMNRPQGMRA